MKYNIEIDDSFNKEWRSENGGELQFSECIGRDGVVTLYFSIEGSHEEYIASPTNIPLFVTELNNFLNSVTQESPTCWYLGFAPFAYGMIDSGKLLVSSAGGGDFYNNIYDISYEEEIEKLKYDLKRDIANFGRVALI